MKARRSIAAAGAAAVIGTTGALALPAAASAHNAAHTLKITATTNKTIRFSRSVIALQESDSIAGKAAGFDVVHLMFTSRTTGTADVALDLSGGLLYGAVATTNGTTYAGKVTGGTGTFKGAIGTIHVRAPGRKTAEITIVYS